MTTTTSKFEALNLLGDLFDTPPTVKKPRPKKKWVPESLVLMYTSICCKHCGHEHSDVSPLILLKENEMNAEGDITATRETSHPKCEDLGVYRGLPVSTQSIVVGKVAFCKECVEEFAEDELHHLFIIQQNNLAEQEANDKKERALVASHRQTRKVKECKEFIEKPEENELMDLLEEGKTS